MQIGTVRTPEGTRAARMESDHIVLLDAPDLGAVLRAGRLSEAATEYGETSDIETANWAPRSPKEWLTDGAELVTSIDGIGELRNRCRRAA